MRKRLATPFIVMIALMGLAGVPQQRPNEDDLAPSEKRIPPGHYCKRSDVKIAPNETNAHPCECKYSCSVDEQGNVTERESPDCLAFCHKNNRRCTCHVEEPCDVKGHAMSDMDGRIVAMPVRARTRPADRSAPSIPTAAPSSVRSTRHAPPE